MSTVVGAPTSAHIDGDINPDALFPCTALQARYLRKYLLSSGADNSIVALRWNVHGDIDADIVERAFGVLIDRYEIFRTALVEVDGKPCQHVFDAVPFTLDKTDLSDLPLEAAMNRADEIGKREAAAPIDPTRAPMIRAAFVRVSSEIGVLHISAHLAALDGWSLGIVIREFGEIVSALKTGKTPELPPITLQFADYALWQREMDRSGAWDDARAYWRQILSGAPRFDAPADKPRIAASGRGEVRTLLLPADLTDKLLAYARGSGATMFNIASATLAAMLRAHVGRSDVLLAMPTALRDEVELEAMVGPEVNSLMLRIDAGGDPTFAQLIDQCADISHDALDHGVLPFASLVEEVGAPHDPLRIPFASVQITQQTAYVDTGRTTNMVFEGGLEIESLPSHPTAVPNDLGFFMVRRDEGLRISCEMNADLFELSSVDRMLRKWAQTIEAMVESQGAATIGSVAYPEVDRFTPGALASLFERAKTAAQAAEAKKLEAEASLDVQAPAAAPVAAATPVARGGAEAEDIIGKVVDLWREVLERPRVNAQSDFFDNGGRSLLAMRMIARTNKTFDVKMRVEELF